MTAGVRAALADSQLTRKKSKDAKMELVGALELPLNYKSGIYLYIERHIHM